MVFHFVQKKIKFHSLCFCHSVIYFCLISLNGHYKKLNSRCEKKTEIKRISDLASGFEHILRNHLTLFWWKLGTSYFQVIMCWKKEYIKFLIYSVNSCLILAHWIFNISRGYSSRRSWCSSQCSCQLSFQSVLDWNGPPLVPSASDHDPPPRLMSFLHPVGHIYPPFRYSLSLPHLFTTSVS